ncbi:MAG TPA: hypothetical protein VK745_10300 [Polyangiaceae bacterium]|nr:hypothetical protein [Polyangiaceae bacterium]
MKSVKFGTIGMLVGCAALMASGAAFAQEPAATTTTTTTTTPVATPAPASAPAPAQAGMALPGATPDAPVGSRDHDGVVGHFAVGYMGRRSMLIDAAAPAVDAPIIGARYWLDPMLGIDVGLGLLFSGGSTSTGGVSVDNQGYSIFMLHGGVPLALAGSKHFSFQIVPELNFGYGSSKRNGVGDDLSAIHFDIGARAGTEIQFGFIGIPELSLQAGIGLAFSVDHLKASPAMGNAVTTSESALGTSVGDNPWNIFTGNIAALYYFD